MESTGNAKRLAAKRSRLYQEAREERDAAVAKHDGQISAATYGVIMRKLDEVERIDAQLGTRDALETETTKGAPMGLFDEGVRSISFGGSTAKNWATARGELRHELTYRPDNLRESNFWAD